MWQLLFPLICFWISATRTLAYDFDIYEEATRADYTFTTIDVNLCVKDSVNGETVLPVPSVSVTSWSGGVESTAQAQVVGDCFYFAGISRGPAMINIQAGNYYSSSTPVDLHIPTSVSSVDYGDILLTRKRDGVTRLVFGGDVMFDRRYFDRGLLNQGTLESDTESLFQYMLPFLNQGDHTNVNLECPIVEDRSTPHPVKRIVLGCYKESAEALPRVGIDSVSLGNNHLYDYLEVGLAETMGFLDGVGMTWFGGGMTRQEARDSRHRFASSGTGVNPVKLSFQGFTNFFDYNAGDAFTTFADFSPIVKGGAMPSFVNELQRFSEAESAAGYVPVPVIHGGKEYDKMQDSGMRADFETSIRAGAKLVIAHHPHTVHGISTFATAPGADPVFIVGSLGNFVFDQDFHATFPGYLTVVDMDTSGRVERMELVPYVIENYIPKPVTISGVATSSSAMGRFVRRIAHMSTKEALHGVAAGKVDCNSPAEGTSSWVKQDTLCGFGGAVPYLDHGKILVVASEDKLNMVDTTSTHRVSLSSSMAAPILVLHELHADSSSLAKLEVTSTSSSSSNPSLKCDLGVDLLRVGGFETETAGEFGPTDYPIPTLWAVSSHRYIQSHKTRTGTGGAVLLRMSTNTGRTTLYYNRRVNVVPGSKVTVRGFFLMENAGMFEVVVGLRSESGSTRYEPDMHFSSPGGDVPDWTEFNLDLDIPADVVEIKTYFRHYPPEANGEGRVFLDDLSFIQWDFMASSIPISPSDGTVDLVTPNGWEFVRCNHDGSGGAEIDMHLTGRIYEPLQGPRSSTHVRYLRNNMSRTTTRGHDGSIFKRE